MLDTYTTGICRHSHTFIPKTRFRFIQMVKRRKGKRKYQQNINKERLKKKKRPSNESNNISVIYSLFTPLRKNKKKEKKEALVTNE